MPVPVPVAVPVLGIVLNCNALTSCTGPSEYLFLAACQSAHGHGHSDGAGIFHTYPCYSE